MPERCSWCGEAVGPDAGYRAEATGGRGAAFCRLEHAVPWALQGPRWEADEIAEPEGRAGEPQLCGHCGGALGESRVLLVRHRGPHRIPDAFCSVDHMAAWARAGGRWR